MFGQLAWNTSWNAVWTGFRWTVLFQLRPLKRIGAESIKQMVALLIVALGLAGQGLIGSVREEVSQKTHGTSQRYPSCIAFRELVQACHDPAVLLLPAKHALDDVALSILGPDQTVWLCCYCRQ